MRPSLIWTTLAACLALICPLLVQGELREFADRQEGILTLRPASRLLFDLVSFEVAVPPEEVDPADSPQVRLYALLPSSVGEGDELSAWVRDLREDYWMIPKRGVIGVENPIFVWSRTDFLDSNGISVDRLRPLVRDAAETVHYASWISCRESSALPEGAGYRFHFESRGAVFATVKLHRENPGADESGPPWIEIRELERLDEPFAGPVTVLWDGNLDGGRAPRGLYSLTVEGELETDELIYLQRSVSFYHAL